MRRVEKVLKKLIVMYIQNSLTLRYTIQTLNLFNSHSFSSMWLTHYFIFYFFVENTKYLTHTLVGRGEKEIVEGHLWKAQWKEKPNDEGRKKLTMWIVKKRPLGPSGRNNGSLAQQRIHGPWKGKRAQRSQERKK